MAVTLILNCQTELQFNFFFFLLPEFKLFFAQRNSHMIESQSFYFKFEIECNTTLAVEFQHNYNSM